MAGRGAKPGERRGGRGIGTPNKLTKEVSELAQQYTEVAIASLAFWARQIENPPAAVAACKELLDRGHGKSTQVVQAIVKHTVRLRDSATLRERLAAALARRSETRVQ